MSEVKAFVAEAEIVLDEGCDPAAVGAAVTVVLCGHWEHDGACRWPHNSAISADRNPARFRTLFVSEAAEENHVRAQIEGALRGGDGWRVIHSRERSVAASERALAERLIAGPRSPQPR